MAPCKTILFKFNDNNIVDETENEMEGDEEIDIYQIAVLVGDITEDSSVKNILLSIVQSQKFLSNKMDQILTEK